MRRLSIRDVLILATIVVSLALRAPVAPDAMIAPAVGPSPYHPASASVNVILFIGDGMGYGQLQAGRKTLRESAGVGAALAIDTMPVQASMTTHAAGGSITDSAASATAMATGHKTLRRRVAVDPGGRRLPTALEAAREAGFATGIVTNAALTSATVAAFAAHALDRGSTGIIAGQMAEAGIDVMLGGGAADFESASVASVLHRRGYSVVRDRAALASVDIVPVLGLFAAGNMSYDLIREGYAEPTLAQMTSKAIGLLSAAAIARGTRFFLVVENDLIDSACHDGDALLLPYEVLALDEAVRAGLEFADTAGGTLVIVAADHETGMVTVGDDGYARFGSFDHSGWDVPLAAKGPGAAKFATATIDNTYIASVLYEVLGVGGD